MDANELLTKQHHEVEEKYDKFKDADESEQATLGPDILSDLSAHAQIEEEFYYPALKEAGDESEVAEYQAEHDEMKLLIGKLMDMDAADVAYAPTMKALMETTLHHAKEEEKEGMPEAEKLLGNEKLEELGPKMEARFKELKGSA